MRRLTFCAFFILLTLVFTSCAFAQEHIENFTTTINLNNNGSINVVEKIDYDFSSELKHGIFRNIPFTKRDGNNKRFDMRIYDFSVVDSMGNFYKTQYSKENEQQVLKIGDADKTITGLHTYILSYKVDGAVGYFNGQDELYWNPTGTQWDVPISTASAVVILPQNVPQDKIPAKCFTGTYGSQDSNCGIYIEGRNIYFFTTQPLLPYQGLSILVGFPNNTVAYLPTTPYVSFWQKPIGILTIILIVVAAILWYLVAPILLVINWFVRGRDPNVGKPVTAWYDPPQAKTKRHLTPAETGALLDEKVDRRDIFAAIVDLARRGYIQIEEKGNKDFYLKKKVPKKNDKLQLYEQELLDGIFTSKEEIRLKDTKLYVTINKVEEDLYKGLVENGFFTKSPKTTRNIYYIIAFLSMFTFNYPLALLSVVFGRIMPRKTLYGAQQANVARGMKNFLSSQERQLKFQADRQMFFEKLLPFAVAFGVEKIWAKRFEKFKLKEPDWYTGYSGARFSSVYFIGSMNDSMRSFTTSSTPPSSSGSGFSSGGGFSGGGGGGGGGGSW